MALSLKGYVLEPVRVGGSNSAYTLTPNDLIANQGTFDSHYTPGSETEPRTEYLVLVQTEGLLVDAQFGWTKNEGIGSTPLARFDYAGRDQRFQTLPGAPIEQVGVLAADSNTNRLKVYPPIGVLAAAPFRISLGTGSGVPFTSSLVTSFGSPPPGTVEILQTTGELNWNASDLTTYLGVDVRFQRQQFYTFKESTGNIGLIEDPSLLNPLPGTGQYPMLRIGFGDWLTPVSKANDAALDPPASIPSGTVQWSRTTGLLAFSSVDLSANPGRVIYYDGALFGWKLSLPRQSIGTVTSPTPITGLPAEGGDLIFHLPSLLPATVYQFPIVKRIDVSESFSSKGKSGQVEVKSDGTVQFSLSDRGKYTTTPVEVVFGDLSIEHGVVMRFFRSTVNLTGSNPTVFDVQSFYTVTGATLADPIIGVPQVYLPAIPCDSFLIHVEVKQGTGSFTGDLNRLDVASPLVGLGYILDFENRQLVYAQRKANQTVSQSEASASNVLPDSLVSLTNLVLEQELAPGMGVYQPLVIGEDVLVDSNSGVVTYTTSWNDLIASGQGTTFTGTLLTDPAADFVAAGVQAGDYLLVQAGTAKGVYQVASRTTTTLTVDVSAPGPATNVLYEVRRNPEIVVDRYWAVAQPLDPVTKVERVTGLGVIQNSTLVKSYSGLTFPGPSTASTTGDFVADGVVPGNTLQLTSGPDSGSYRRIVSVTETEAQVSPPFTSFSSANGQVVSRLGFDPAFIGASRVRLGGTELRTLTSVATDGNFTVPGAMPAGQVEVSLQTGNLNFGSQDLVDYAGQQVYWVKSLTNQLDYRVNAGLGFIEFTDRFLAYEEALITYAAVTDPIAGTIVGPIVERARFLVRKEVTQPYPRASVVSSVQFNPTGRTVADSPVPQVYRGGRPQTVGTQVNINTATSTIQFIPNTGFMTDALPSGSQVQTDERIYVDYYVYEALGGEKSVSVLQPPMSVIQVSLSTGANSFTLVGDQTTLFPAGYLLRVGDTAVYPIASSTFAPPDSTYQWGLTTVTLGGGNTFNDDFLNPTLYVSSGEVRTTTSGLYPSYFRTEPTGYKAISRGSNRIQLVGDRLGSYQEGTLVLFTNGTSIDHYYPVTGASLTDTGYTVVTLATNTLQEYKQSSFQMKYSVRPVINAGQTKAQTDQIPVLSEGYTMFRRVEGSVGTFLTGVTLSDVGSFDFGTPLQPLESLGVFYTGYRTVPAGTKLRASYTCVIAPNSLNGLENQILSMDYTVHNPDTFFYRVETLTNFIGEVKLELENQAKGSSPTAGPTTSNASQPVLYEQGRESVYFTEGHLANVDYVCRVLLKFYNDNINHLEDLLQDIDGRVVGEVDGRFRFDGNIDNPVRAVYSQVTNEIDDQIEKYGGKTIPLYQVSNYSRFFPAYRKTLYGETDTSGVGDGDPILDWGQTNLDSLPGTAFRRWPRAQLVKPATIGDTTLYVDNARGTTDLLRHEFVSGMKVRITAQDGTVILPNDPPTTVSSVPGSGDQRIEVPALAVDVPVGATVFLSTKDDSYQKSYRIGTDVGVNKSDGLLTYIEPYWPFDGTVPLIPAELEIQPPGNGEYLQMNGVGIFNVDKAPKRFPAMDGLAVTDTNDQGLPIQSPQYEQELYFLQAEEDMLNQFVSDVTPTAVVSGVHLDITRTVLTRATPFPSPPPQLWDLVRFETGPNTGTYRRISFVNLGLNLLNVDEPFPTPSSVSGDDAIITASLNVSTGSATFPFADVLDDATLSPTILVGFTVVFTSGLNAGVRCQVVEILSSTQLRISPSIPLLVPTTYRVSNHMSTYSALTTDAPDGSIEVLLTNDHHTGPYVDSEVLSVERFYDGDVLDGTEGVLSDLLSPPSSSGVVSGTTLTDTAQDFITLGVNTSHFVFVRNGLSQGFFQVATVTGPTTLDVDPAFPASGPVLYRIVKPFGVGKDALVDTFLCLTSVETYEPDVVAWSGLVSATLPVVLPIGVPAAYANPLLYSDVTTRQAGITTRKTFLGNTVSGPIPLVEDITTNRDRLYDTRYSWVDSRINLMTGLLYRIERAKQDRADNLVKTTNQLLQLLSLSNL